MPIDYSHIEAKRLVVHTWDKCAHKVFVDSAYMHQATMGSQTANLNCPECEQLKHGGANVAATSTYNHSYKRDDKSISKIMNLPQRRRGLSEADIRAEIGRQGRESLKRRPEKCVAPKKTALDATATVFKPKTSG